MSPVHPAIKVPPRAPCKVSLLSHGYPSICLSLKHLRLGFLPLCPNIGQGTYYVRRLKDIKYYYNYRVVIEDLRLKYIAILDTGGANVAF